MNDNIEIVVSKDGSNTLYRSDLNEHYHSKYGAIQESKHIFIEAGLKPILVGNREVNILEVGFGTGLNALLTILENKNNKINYFGVEPILLDSSIIEQLNYTDCIDNIHASDVFKSIHKTKWNHWNQISTNFHLYKSHTKIEETKLQESYFDLVYFDAFSPDTQGELWTAEVFTKISHSLKNEGSLVTYSCKGLVKRALKESGFKIKKLPGPEGKREILHSTKTQAYGL